MWHVCLHFDGYGDWIARQTNEKHKQILNFKWIRLVTNKWFTILCSTSSSCGAFRVSYPIIWLWTMSTALEWCIVAVLRSFKTVQDLFQVWMKPKIKMSSDALFIQQFMASSFSNGCLCMLQDWKKIFGAEMHFNCTLGCMALCVYAVKNHLVCFNASDGFCVQQPTSVSTTNHSRVQH